MLWELIVIASTIAFCGGCQTTRTSALRPVLPNPYNAASGVTLGRPESVAIAPATSAPQIAASQSLALDAAEASLRAATQAEQTNSPASVDYYYQAAIQSWPYVGPQIESVVRTRAWGLYHNALSRLVVTGQRFNRLQANRGLQVNTPAGAGFVAIEYGGFPWHPDDFNRLEPAGLTNLDPKIDRKIMQEGLGVPLVAVRERPTANELLPKHASFAATAILEPGVGFVDQYDVVQTAYAPSEEQVPAIATLRLVDPTRIDQMTIAGQPVPIARDLSAPLSNSLSTQEESPIDRLLRPVTPNSYDGLQMLEPYQPGKIPVVFVHGLISDRSTWANMTNELKAIPWVNARYQFWYFQYPTGEPFLRSAMTMREQTRAAVQQLDPQGQDPALSQMVLVGHSMGGLVSKLQVAYSSNTIWDAYSNRPFSAIQGQPQVLDQVWRLFFFEPQRCVKRVVFIGTPHQGAALASRMVGRFAADMVQQPADRQQMHRSLVAANPDAFHAEFRQRIPTSVDLLEPDSPLLASMRRLSLSSDVRIHSIVGTRSGLLGAASDGVVPVTNARHPGATSEYFINAGHGQLTRHSETIGEVSRILAEHLHELSSR